MSNEVSKMTPYTDGKRRKMVMTKLTAVALTAHGANPEANVTFFKSVDKPVTVVDKSDMATLFTSIEEGHQHGINIETYDGQLYLNVMYAKSAEAEDGHYHSVTSDGMGYAISMNAGHTHTVDSDIILQAIFSNLNKGIGEDTITSTKAATLIAIDIDGSQKHMEDTIMPELQELLDKANDELVKSQAKLKTAVALGSLNDAQKAYYRTLETEDKLCFIAKTNVDRQVEVEMAAKADAIEYTATDGTTYRKSAGSAMIALAKRLDIQATQLASQTALTKHGEFIKRAGSELGNMVGEEATKVALLKAIDTIECEETKKSIADMFAAANSTTGLALKTFGSQTPATYTKAEDGLEAMAKAYAADKGVNISTAYEKVLATPEGQALYNQASSQK